MWEFTLNHHSSCNFHISRNSCFAMPSGSKTQINCTFSISPPLSIKVNNFLPGTCSFLGALFISFLPQIQPLWQHVTMFTAMGKNCWDAPISLSSFRVAFKQIRGKILSKLQSHWRISVIILKKEWMLSCSFPSQHLHGYFGKLRSNACKYMPGEASLANSLVSRILLPQDLW